MSATGLPDHRATPPTPSSARPAQAAVVLVAALTVLVVVAAMRPVGDPDTFWHIHAGQFLWQSGQFVGPDPWSRFSTAPWVLHEWLPELGLAGLFSLGGFTAVAWAQAVLDAGILVVAYLCARRHAGPLIAASTAGLALVGVTGGLAARPQLVTFMLTCVVTSVWITTARDGKARWWLIGLAWAWACIHGMWSVGIVVGAVTVTAMAIERRHPWRQLARLAAIPALSLVATAVTPVGPGLLLTPFQVGKFTGFVMEWRSPTIHDAFFVAVLAMAVLTAASWALSAHRVPLSLVALWCVGLGWAVLYGRTVAVGAMTMAPVLAASLAGALRQGPSPAMPRFERGVLAVGCLVALGAGALVAPSLGSGTGSLVPGGLTPTLASLPPRTVVFNEYGLGGWLMLTQPQLDPVVDERTELYSIPYLTKHTEALLAQPGWRETLRDDGATVALLSRGQPLATALRADGWCLAGTDREFELLTARGC